MTRIAAVGPRTEDVIERPGQPTLRRSGGAPHYAGRAIRYAGAEAVVIETPGLVVSRFHEGGQSLDRLAEPATPEWVRGQLDELRGCDLVVLGPQSAGDFPPETLALLAAEGVRTLLDCQGIARGHRTGPVRPQPFGPEAVAGVSVLKLNAHEARAAAGDDPAALLSLGVPEVLLSLGEDGAAAVTARLVERVPSNGLHFADPTGAGESLAAFYCVGRARGAEPAEAVREAVAMVERLYTA